MKRFTTTILIALSFMYCASLVSCNASKVFISAVQSKCKEEKRVINPATGSIEIQYGCYDLWDSTIVSSKCSSITACVNVANASVTFAAKCDSTIDVSNLTSIFTKSKKKK